MNNVYADIKSIVEKLSELAAETGLPIVTATQLTGDGFGTTIL